MFLRNFLRLGIMTLFARFIFFIVVCFPSFSKEYVIVDEESEAFIEDIVNEIKSALNYKPKINVYILNNKVLNAAANQRGDIIINSGAITSCSDVKEFIAIIAHEVGHIAGNHIATFLSNQTDFVRAGLITMLIGATASIFAHDVAPFTAGVFGGQNLAQKMALSKLRQKENMADSKSAQSMKILGWPVFKGFVSIHEKLSSGSPLYNAYESTHPASVDRVSKFRELYREEQKSVPDQKKVDHINQLQKRFSIIQSKIKALTLDPSYVIDLYREPKNDIDVYAKSIALYRMNKFDESQKLIDTIMDSELLNAVHLAEIKAMCLIGMRNQKLAAKVAFQHLDGKKKPHRDLGIIYAAAVVEGNIGKEEANKGIKILKKLQLIYPEDLSIVDMLGRLYFMNNENDNAELCSAEIAYATSDIEMAIRHAKKALKSENKFISRKAADILENCKR